MTGLQVSLYKLIDGRWTYINEGVTNTSGKFYNFVERNDFQPGRYKLHFDVDRYFEGRKQNTMYPFIEVRLWVKKDSSIVQDDNLKTSSIWLRPNKYLTSYQYTARFQTETPCIWKNLI